MSGTIFVSGWAHPVSDLDPLLRLLSPTRGRLTALNADDDVVRALTKETEPTDLIGWSLGGLRALEAACLQPARVRRLVLISGTARYCQDEDYPCGQPAVFVRSLRQRLLKDPKAALTEFFRFCAAPATLKEPALARQIKLARASKDKDLAARLDLLTRYDLRTAVVRLAVPTLLLHGEHDEVIPVEAARWLADHMPRARLEIRAETGHDLPRRLPEWVAERALAFIR